MDFSAGRGAIRDVGCRAALGDFTAHGAQRKQEAKKKQNTQTHFGLFSRFGTALGDFTAHGAQRKQEAKEKAEYSDPLWTILSVWVWNGPWGLHGTRGPAEAGSKRKSEILRPTLDYSLGLGLERPLWTSRPTGPAKAERLIKVDTSGAQAAIDTQAYSCCGLCVPRWVP